MTKTDRVGVTLGVFKNANDTAGGSLLRGTMRAIAEYFEAEGKPHLAQEVNEAADKLLPTPNPGWTYVRETVDDIFDVWRLVREGRRPPRKSLDQLSGYVEFIRKVRDR